MNHLKKKKLLYKNFFFKMDNLHFILNNIFTIFFFKELTKYKNDYQQYLNYICRVAIFWLGPKVNGIQAQSTHYNEFVESGSKSQALMSLTTVNVDVRDDRIGTRNTKLDGLIIQGDELTIRGCELLSSLIKQSTKGNMSFSFPLVLPPYGRSLILYSSLWTILVLHLLVIHAYT